MKTPADYVNPYIGTISHMLASTRPEVMLPYGMARSTPVVKDCGDYYCNDRIQGYPMGLATVMPGKGGDFENTLDHSREDFRCYRMEAELEEHGITVASTVTAHVYVHRFTGADALRLDFSGGEAEEEGGWIRIRMPIEHPSFPIFQYVLIRVEGGAKVLSCEEGSWVLSSPADVCILGAVSYISFEKAAESMEKETAGKDFMRIAAEAKAIWDAQLSKARVEGNTEEKKTVYYTALFRAFMRMTDYTEYGQYFSAYDGKVHDGVFYTGDGLWDTFRCMHPLQLLLDPARHRDILESYNLMYRQSGLMPCFPGFTGDLPVMIGFHAASLFADAAAKGVEADYATAYEGIRKNAMEQSMFPWCCGKPLEAPDICYQEKGYFPALARGEEETCESGKTFERRQAVAVTLEHAYDDWCAARLAKRLGKKEDYEMFLKRGQNYRTLYNPENGWMSPKDSQGNWVEDFDPKFAGGMGGRDYTTENNTWTYTWSVFHDPEGLAELMGGKEEAVKRLDQHFREGFEWPESKYGYLGQFPDSTGLMGQFAMGNEPSFHIPYLYDYFGAPWKAQKKLRELMDIWFTDSPTGICGDEDGGAMSSWFVFSALGFYPVCPGKPEYALGTPLFDRAEIQVGDGRVFRVISPGAGEGKRYIRSAMLNGKPLERPFLTHEQIVSGGELVLEMDRRPTKTESVLWDSKCAKMRSDEK